MHKLSDQRGETLVETMASIVIAALSVALLFACVMASLHINRMAQTADEAYYKALTDAETQKEDGDYLAKDGEVTIKNEESAASKSELDISISLYGGEGMYAYAVREDGGTGP